MKLVTFEIDGNRGVGAVEGESQLVGLSDAGMPPDMIEFIALGDIGLDRARTIVGDPAARRVRLDQVNLLAPIPTPKRNIFCVGKNYHEHVGEF